MIAGPGICDEGVHTTRGPLDSQSEVYQTGSLEILGHYGGGDTSELILRGNHAYSVLGHELIRLDLSDPRDAKRSGYYYSESPLKLLDVAPDKPVATVQMYSSLWSVDFSDSQEVVAQNLYNTPLTVLGVRVGEDRAYLHVERCAYDDTIARFQLCRDGLQVVDLSQGGFVDGPERCTQDLMADLERAWIFRDFPEAAVRSAATGKYEVTATGGAGIRIYDELAPGNLTTVGAYDPPSKFQRVHLAGHFAYVAEREGPLHVLDISAPRDPKKIGEYSDYSDFIDLEQEDGTVLHAIAEAGNRYVALDISKPQFPRLINTTTTETRYRELKAAGDKVYLLEDKAGIHIMEPARSEQSALLALDGPGLPIDFDVRDHLVYVLVKGEIDGGVLLAVDARLPDRPRLLSVTQLKNPRAVAVSGHTLFLLEDGLLQTYDVSDPTAPELIRERSEKYGRGLTVVGDMLYLLVDWDHLLVQDISDPLDPLTIASYVGVSSIEGFDQSEPDLLALPGVHGLLLLRLATEH